MITQKKLFNLDTDELLFVIVHWQNGEYTFLWSVLMNRMIISQLFFSPFFWVLMAKNIDKKIVISMCWRHEMKLFVLWLFGADWGNEFFCEGLQRKWSVCSSLNFRLVKFLGSEKIWFKIFWILYWNLDQSLLLSKNKPRNWHILYWLNFHLKTTKMKISSQYYIPSI